MKTCVLIPTYNEAKTIGELVNRVRKEGFDIVVVDDGSSDDTAQIARQVGATLITHSENKGKGASLKTGFQYVLKNDYDAVIIMDGDGQHSPHDIRRFIDTVRSTNADLIVGNRMDSTKSMPFVRRATNKWMSGFLSRICGQEIPDTQCGFRLIKKDVLKKIKLNTSKYETESEILIRAGKKGFKIGSIPIKSIYNNEISSIHPLIDACRFARLIVSIFLERLIKS
ncbi:MAG: glycosyltransferase family 2 protein [Candidatus Omnitrophica bacterium]|nr:glycosyltransferase family 2 protein [Candidatus Omnitrophota bacterium]